MNKVKMTHSKMGDTEIMVAESAVPIHMASGWLPVDDKVAKESKGLIPADMVPESDEKPAKRTVTKES